MKKTISIALILFSVVLSTSAQYLKSGQIDPGTSGSNFRIADCNEGTEWSEDDNFYISRVKPKARFVNQHTQVNQEIIPWWQFLPPPAPVRR